MVYEEIIKLNKYCNKIGLETKLTPFYDGYKITFANGDFCMQYCNSCTSTSIGYNWLQFVTVCGRSSGFPMSLDQAKNFVKRYCKKLNNEV